MVELGLAALMPMRVVAAVAARPTHIQLQAELTFPQWLDIACSRIDDLNPSSTVPRAPSNEICSREEVG
jgi:hypothetical protein